VWAEGNSEGQRTLSFEVATGGVKSLVKRVEREWSKNILRLERLAPCGLHAGLVEYRSAPGKPAEWGTFPFGAKESKVEVTLRAVFEQRTEDRKGKLTPWAGSLPRVQGRALERLIIEGLMSRADHLAKAPEG
jgi:hypothetical protein